MPKTIPESKFQELKGLDRISLIVHEMKCLFREINKDDIGIDGEIEVLTPKPDGKGYQTTGGVIKVQSKSGMSYVKQDSATGFASPIKKDDLELWYNSNYPTLYIVYHPGDDKLYWKEMQSYIKGTPNIWQPPHKVLFDKATDEFTPNCFQSVRELAPSTSSPRISFTDQERLFSNLLRIRRLPKVWSASTTAKSYEEVRLSIHGFAPPFQISAGRIYSLSNLNQAKCVLKPYYDTADIHLEQFEVWWNNEDKKRDYVFMLNQLLGIHLRRCGIRYNKKFKRNYFPRENETELEFETGWYNIRTDHQVPPRQTVKFYVYGHNRFWRHTAVELSFKFIGHTWYLQIMPKYFFTEDGIVPWDSEKVGEYTTQIKAYETNLPMLNHILFWSDVLSRDNPSSADASSIVVRLDLRSVMIIERLPVFGISKFAIPFDPATFEEPEPSNQLNIFGFLDQLYEDDDDDQD